MSTDDDVLTTRIFITLFISLWAAVNQALGK